jgi:hypothetical protein
MSYESSQLSPHMGTHSTHREVFVSVPEKDKPPRRRISDVTDPQVGAQVRERLNRSLNARSTNAQVWHSYRQVWRSWMQGAKTPVRLQMNWSAICAMAATVVVGAGFWTGLGFLVARLWK